MNNWSQAWPTTENETLEQKLEKLSRDEVLMKWEDAKNALDKAKEMEMELRKYVVKKAFPTPNEGTNKVELGNGFELKAVVGFNYNLKDNITVEATLDKIASQGNYGKFIADQLVSWTPNFLLSQYRKIQTDAERNDEAAKQILKLCHEMLVLTDKAPSVEIKENKKKK